jgi:hypothetical protein
MHFSEALIEAGKILQRPVTALGSDGCPFIDVHIKRRSDPSLLRQCREDYVALMAWIQRQSRGTVLISSVDRYWWDPEYLVSDNATFTKSDYRLNSKTLNSGLMKTVSDLQKAGHKVVLIQTIPHFIAEPYKLKSVSCSGWSVLTGSCRRPLSTMPREFADNWQIVSRSGYLAVAEASGVGVLDLREFFCPNGLCSTRHSDGTDLYMLDGYHLNKFGSALLQEEFVKRLASLE